MAPDGAFFDLHRLPSWSQYALASKSLVEALRLDDPDETLFCQLTISELSLVSLSLLVLSRVFPEFVDVASDLSTKVTQLSDEQQFLRRSVDEDK